MSKKQKFKKLRLILGDQLNELHSWFDEENQGEVLYTLMEITPESEYVTHHIQKIVGIFQAMRNFSDLLIEIGLHVVYFKISQKDNQQSFQKNLKQLIEDHQCESFEYQEPDEYRLDKLIREICDDLNIDSKMVSSEHFLTDRSEVKNFFEGKKTYLMENFYRYMRKKHHILMDDGEPLTGQWNYDKSNRKKLPSKHKPESPFLFHHNVSQIVEEIEEAGIKYIGNINKKDFLWPKDRKEGLEMLDYFIANMLANFGDFQDAMTDQSWSIYHSRISFAMNLKLMNPKEVIDKVEKAFNRNENIDIATAEGFIRQILGWREYMRGLYWAQMPGYENLNYFEHDNDLPEFYWTGKTKMNCLKKAIGQSLEHAYAHHIQRLMVTGNFALLAGIDPDQVDEWYLGIYIDAFEWVEITNTRGMSQYADGGIVASKPYISSASYIHKMSDHCKGCYYNYKEKTGDRACPFNSLYWNFIDRHYDKLQNNPRMGMMLNLWDKMESKKKETLLKQAAKYLDSVNDL